MDETWESTANDPDLSEEQHQQAQGGELQTHGEAIQQPVEHSGQIVGDNGVIEIERKQRCS